MSVADENLGAFQDCLCKFRPFGGVVGTGFLDRKSFPWISKYDRNLRRGPYFKKLLTKRTRVTMPGVAKANSAGLEQFEKWLSDAIVCVCERLRGLIWNYGP